MPFLACVPSSSSRMASRTLLAVPACARRLVTTSATTASSSSSLPNSAVPSISSAASSSTPTAAQNGSDSTPTQSASASPPVPTHYLITLRRSTIALPKVYAATLRSLGLYGRARQSVLHPFSAEIGGKILRVKELVSVRNVTEAEGRVLKRRKQPEGAGLVVTGRAYGGGRGRQ